MGVAPAIRTPLFVQIFLTSEVKNHCADHACPREGFFVPSLYGWCSSVASKFLNKVDNCISCHFCGWNSPCGTQIRLDYALWNIYICIFSWLNSWSGSHWAIAILVHPMTLYGNTVSKNLLAYTWPVIDLIFSICRWFSIKISKIILLYDIHFYSFPWHIIHLWAIIDIYIYGDYLQLLIPC